MFLYFTPAFDMLIVISRYITNQIIKKIDLIIRSIFYYVPTYYKNYITQLRLETLR